MVARTFDPRPELGLARAPAVPSALADPSRPKVLLVEDEADMRAYLRKHLAPHYEVLEAADGDAGLQMVRQEMPDVIVSDILMPGLDGYALCRALKSDAATNFIPVILLSVRTEQQSRIDAFECGADYLSNPCDPAELLLRIRNRLLARALFMRLTAHELRRRE